jgi:predicted TPR repeat methyltransferase
MSIESRYIEKSYIESNPDWDRSDAPWKALHVLKILKDNKIGFERVCELGCGSGDILHNILNNLPSVTAVGYDISPHLEKFWKKHSVNKNLKLICGDFSKINTEIFDLLLMIDVFEHVRDPFTFLEEASKISRYFVFHIPLDLSVTAVARGYPLLNSRHKVGHIHYYTKDLALATLNETGYEIIEWRYTGASLGSPNRSFLTHLISPLRRFFYFVNRDLAVRLIGGDTLLVLARQKSDP